MAFNQVQINALIILTKIGVSSELIASMASASPPVKVKSHNNSIAVYAGDEPVVTVPVTPGELAALATGSLETAKKLKLCKALSDAISAHVKLDPEGVPSVPALADTPQPLKVAPKTAAPQPTQAIPAVPIKNTAPWDPVPEAAMLNTARVKLKDATRMYQPVFGTSTGSRYFLVAGSNSVKVAARFKGDTLSVRVEGPVPTAVAANLKHIKFNQADDGHHSLHFDVGGDLVLASKTLGALLAAMGCVFDTPVPLVAKIAGKGV